MQLTRSPLVLVLAQVIFETIHSINDKNSALKEAFRLQGYPILKDHASQEVSIQDAGIELRQRQRTEALSADEHRSVLFDMQSLVLQEASYEHFDVFAPRLIEALNTLHQVVSGPLIIRRLGLRYVDWLRPENGLQLEDLLNSRIKSYQLFPGDAPPVVQSFQQFVSMTSEHSGMTLRVVRGHFTEVLPGELIPLAPKMKPEVQALPNQETILLDFDHVLELTGPERVYEQQRFEALLREHQKPHSKCFRNAVTQQALDNWGYTP